MSLDVTIQVSADGQTWHDVQPEVPVLVGEEEFGATYLTVHGPRHNEHVVAWGDHLVSQARRDHDSSPVQRIRYVRKAERAHARLARSPKRDWWGRPIGR